MAGHRRRQSVSGGSHVIMITAGCSDHTGAGAYARACTADRRAVRPDLIKNPVTRLRTAAGSLTTLYRDRVYGRR